MQKQETTTTGKGRNAQRANYVTKRKVTDDTMTMTMTTVQYTPRQLNPFKFWSNKNATILFSSDDNG